MFFWVDSVVINGFCASHRILLKRSFLSLIWTPARGVENCRRLMSELRRRTWLKRLNHVVLFIMHVYIRTELSVLVAVFTLHASDMNLRPTRQACFACFAAKCIISFWSKASLCWIRPWRNSFAFAIKTSAKWHWTVTGRGLVMIPWKWNCHGAAGSGNNQLLHITKKLDTTNLCGRRKIVLRMLSQVVYFHPFGRIHPIWLDYSFIYVVSCSLKSLEKEIYCI